MRFIPRTEEDVQKEANKFGPWPNGVYDFEIVEAQERTSSKGNDMIELTIHIYNSDGDRRVVRDYLMEAIPHKLRHAAEACNLMHRYESGELMGVDFYGKTGRVKLGIQPEKDGYAAKNVVRDYIKLGPPSAPRQAPAAPRPSPQRVSVPAGDLDDEIPF